MEFSLLIQWVVGTKHNINTILTSGGRAFAILVLKQVYCTLVSNYDKASRYSSQNRLTMDGEWETSGCEAAVKHMATEGDFTTCFVCGHGQVYCLWFYNY